MGRVDGVGLCGVSKSMLGKVRTEERVEKTGVKGREWGEKISHGQNQGVNVSEHIL